MRRFLLKGEDGVSVVIVAIVVVVLFGFTALAVDVARAYEERRQLQTTADASALAGARAFIDAGSLAAAEAEAQAFVANNVTVHHTAGYDPVSGDLVQAYSAGSGPAQCLGLDCVVATIVAPERSDANPDGFEYMFARVLGFDKRSISATAAAVLGAGAPGGDKLVPWMVTDCPNPALYPDETAAVHAAVLTVNPNCVYPSGYPVSDDYDNGTRVELFLSAGGGSEGNFQASALELEPACPIIDGRFRGTGGATYRSLVAGDPKICNIGVGARAYSEDGVMVGPTSQGLNDRGVNACMNKTAFLEAVDVGTVGDGLVTIKKKNPCLMALLLTVTPDPAKSAQWDQDVPGASQIANWQHPLPLDVANGRFAKYKNGKKAYIVRRFGAFYLTERGNASTPYKGLFMRMTDSGDSDLDTGAGACTAATAICVVKLVS